MRHCFSIILVIVGVAAFLSNTLTRMVPKTHSVVLLYLLFIGSVFGESQLFASTDNCTQLEAHGNNLQEVLLNVSLAQQSVACVQINVAPGGHTISQALNLSRDVILQGTGEGVVISFNVRAGLYVMQFESCDFVVLQNIHFNNSVGIIGFENVTEVLINNCTFSYFNEGAVDIYNCLYPKVTNCIFQNNGPITAIKPQPYRGYSGGLSIGLNIVQTLHYDLAIYVSNCKFINNSAIVTSIFQSSSNALQMQTYTGRGGGASILVNTYDPVNVSVEGCVFMHNDASSSAGGMFMLLDGTSNVIVALNRTVFFQNRGFISGSGAIQISFRDSGTEQRLHSASVYNSEFIENSGIIGGALYFRFTSFSSQQNGIIDNAYVKNCTFINNTATEFGGAFAGTSFVTLVDKTSNGHLDVCDCIFKANRILNSIAGILSVAHVSINFTGTNNFSDNIGSAISLTVSIMTIKSGGSLQLINNTNSGQVGGALYVSTLGQIILNDNIQVKFHGNSGRFGAAIVTDGFIPPTLQYTPNIGVCFIQYPGTNPVEWASHNISFSFIDNNASLGSAVYTTNIRSCLSSDDYEGTVQMFELNFTQYQHNVNRDYQGDLKNNSVWNVQTPPASMKIQNQSLNVSAYAGGKLKIHISVVGELGDPVSAILRLSDVHNEHSNDTYRFPKSLVLFDDLSNQTFDTEFHSLFNGSDPHDVQITTIQTHIAYQTTFHISQLPCNFGFTLSSSSSGYHSCKCNDLNPAIANCLDTTVKFTIESGGLWANMSSDVNAYGDTMATYPCPMGYCHCIISEKAGGTTCIFAVNTSDANSQCDCQRTGVLCGNCKDGFGVSALLNQCVPCGNASGLLIAGLIIGDVTAIILMVLVGASIPSWLQPCVFYLQLYYVSSGLSFYFAYDFCLYSNMSPLVSYFIRYLPLFTAIIVFPITLAIRRRIFQPAPWHGLWWLVTLMYTHVVHTSMSILNCPRLPGKDGNSASVWYINGNIECFTGWHMPLAILAILVLILCVAAIPIAAGTKKIPILANKYIGKFIPTLGENYNDGLEWFVALELIRRMISVLLIVAVPFTEHASIIFIAIMMAGYGFIKPYKQMWSNVLEVALAVDAIIMLLLKNTDQLLQLQQSSQLTSNKTDVCTDYEDVLGLTPLVMILAPFYYIPLCALVLGTAIWFSVNFYKYTTLQRNTQRPLSTRNTAISTENNNGKMTELKDWTVISMSTDITESVVSVDRLSSEVSVL